LPTGPLFTRIQRALRLQHLSAQEPAPAGFEYSEAMRQKAAAGLRGCAILDRFIADPEAVVPGARMRVPPLRDD